MLTIKHLSGPLAGKVEKIDPSLDRVMFGRRVNCEVSYPPEETLVAREHFALVRKPPGAEGHWTVELFGEPFVAINGIPAEPGQKVPPDAKFELGKRGGPSFEVIAEADATTDNLARTMPQEQDIGARGMVERVGKSSAMTRRLALTGLGVAVVAAGAAEYFHVAELGSKVSDAVRQRLIRAAYFVVTPNGLLETIFGTAVPIGKRLLATNAHVAGAAAGLEAGQKMVVRSPGRNGKVYEVVATKAHPGYQAFLDFIGTDYIRRNNAGLIVPGYDVALLEVKDDLPAEDVLTLASDDELRALKAGSPLATAGYPTEAIAGGAAQQYGSTPQFHEGAITETTDFFFLPSDFAHSQLVQHSLPSAGGSSGSPIVTPSGHVVALLSAGNSAGKEGQRISSGVLINYGQRVDLLRHLIDGAAAQEVKDDQPYWQRQFNTFKSGMDIIAEIITSNLRTQLKDNGVVLKQVSDETATLPAAASVAVAVVNGGQPATAHRKYQYKVPMVAGTAYAIIAYAPADSPIELWVYNGNQIVVHDGADSDKAADQSAARWVAFPAPKGAASVTAWVVGVADVDAKVAIRVMKIEKIAAPSHAAADPPPDVPARGAPAAAASRDTRRILVEHVGDSWSR
jgi:Trypsin-like peptidase domain